MFAILLRLILMYPTQQGILKPEQWEKFEKEAIKVEQCILNAESSDESIESPQDKEINKLCDDAYQEGYNKGQEDTIKGYEHEQATNEQKKLTLIETQNTVLNSLVNIIDDKSINIAASIQNECIKIIQKTVHEILKAELSLNPEKLHRAIDDALKLLTGDEDISLYIHPDSHDKISTIFPHGHINVFSDPSLTPGDFYLTQGYSKLDGRLETRVEQAILSLFDHK